MTSFIDIKVKSTLSDAETLNLSVNVNETVRKLKLIVLNKLTKYDSSSETIVAKRDQDSISKRVRLIYNGRLLQPDVKSIKEFNIADKSYIHAVISNEGPKKDYSREGEEPINELSALNDGNIIISGDNNGSYVGLNRLLRNGFSAEEIQALRFLFSVNIRAFRQVMPQRHHETDDMYQLRLEDAFLESENIYMRNESVASSFLRSTHGSANSNTIVLDLSSNSGSVRVPTSSSSNSDDEETGDQRDFWFGFLVGITVGFIVLFCVWDRNISYRQKLGLLFGVAISTLLEMYSAEKISSSSSSEHKTLRGSQN